VITITSDTTIKADTNTVVSKGIGMINAKNIEIKKLSITKQEFKSALKRVSQKIEKSKSASK
jgi:hypothetical protein